MLSAIDALRSAYRDVFNVPDNSSAGDWERLPGIGSSLVLRRGVPITASRVCWSTLEVSQVSKPSS